MFNLLSYFSVSSAIVIAVLSIGVGNIANWYETSRLVDAAEKQNEAAAVQIVAKAWDPHAAYLTSTTERDPTTLKQSWQVTDIDLAVRQATLRLPVLKVRIYKPDGLMLYSSDLSEVGRATDTGKPLFASALSGRAASKLKHVPSILGMSGTVKDISTVETYLPKFADGRVVGVVEVYTDVTASSVGLINTIRTTVLFSIGVCLLLYASLYLIVARADKLIKAQYLAQQGFSDRLEREVSHRTNNMLGQQRKLGELMRSPQFQAGSLDDAFAALNKGATDILDVDRCGIYIPVEDASHYDVIDVYDRREGAHTGRFSYPASYFLSGFKRLHEGETVCISDIEASNKVNPHFLKYYCERSIRSAMDVPIFIDGRQAGVLCFRNGGGPRDWRADEQLTAGALATLAALVMQRVEREKAEASIQARTRFLVHQQAILTEIAREVAMPSMDLDTVLRPMLRRMTEGAGCCLSGIWILSPDRQAFSYAEKYSALTEQIEPVHVSEQLNILSLARHAKVAEPIAISDVRAHPMIEEQYKAVLVSVGVIAFLRAPIVIDGNLCGFVSCAATKPTAWATEQSLFITGIANITALAIERHQRRRAERQIVANAEVLSRQQTVINELMHSESFRNGSFSAAIRKLARTFAQEAGIDRVAITVRAVDSSKIEYAETYVREKDAYTPQFEGNGYGPTRMLAAAKAGRAIIADDVETHPETQQYLVDLLRPIDARSFLQIPIEVGGAVVGTINATTCGRSVAWSASQKMFATAIGNLAALTIERDQRQRFQRAVASVAARLEVQQAAIAGFMSDESWRQGDLVDAVRGLSKMAADTLGIERISIWKMSTDGREICALTCYDQRTDSHAEGMTLTSAEHPQYFASLLRDGVVASDDVAADRRLATLQPLYLSPNDVRSMLDMPILMGGAPVGIVRAETCGNAIAWSEEHRLFLSAITSLVALAIERLDRQRAENEIVISARRLASMLESFSSLMRSDVVRLGSLQDTLRELSRVLCHEIGADRAAVLLVESKGNAVVSAEAYARETGAHGAPLFPPTRSWPELSQHIDITSSLAIEDVASQPGYLANEQALVETHKLGSLLQLPVIIDGEVTGAIRATTIGRKVKWTSEARLFAAAIAQLTSLAIERNSRQRIERELRHANIAAQQANRAKSQFLANMSHEIRTPMNGVFGMTEILVKSPLSERQRRQIGTIHSSAKTLLTIVNDILDLSRIEDGKMPIDAQMFDLHHCIESAAEFFAEDALSKGLELRVFIAPETPTHVIGDAVRLRQVCVNLISNAIKFTKHGAIDIRLSSRVALDGQAQIGIEIRDTGIGIDSTTAARLFEPFTQADSSISRRFGGTGLGLSISRHLISLMGGSVKLDSRPDHGTRVSVTLTCAVAVGAVPANAGVEELKGRRVLVVDDRDTNREIMVEYLAGAGAQPVNARTGEMALEILDAAASAGHPFAAVIVDMLMPDMDGMTVCRHIRDSATLPPTGIVMVTSMTWDGDLLLANALGITRLLTKPVRRSDLLEAVARAVVEPRPAALTTAPVALVESANFQAHILVAEDNPVNEEVIRELLLAMGCTFKVANDGRAACTAFESEAFDMVLMDCQMPEMDGLTATVRMRQLEKALVRSRTPIIAVTAHAFDADRIACRNAGMDDYLMKPFTEGELARVLQRWLSPTDRVSVPEKRELTAERAPLPTQIAIVSETAPAELDEAFLADLRARRPQLFERLLSAYLTHSPKNVGQLLDAVAEKQSDALYLAAHSLKSSSANVGAKRIAELARRIEAMARVGSLDDIVPVADDLRIEFARTLAAMRAALEQVKAAKPPKTGT